MDVSSGWVQILRGPRPRSVRWPRATAQRPQRQGSPKDVQQFCQSVQTGSGVALVHSLSRSPETVAVEAAAEVKQLEAAIGVLGENNIHAKSLHEALRVARNKMKLPPIQEQVEFCKSFLERARKRVLRAQAVIDSATEQKAVYEKEVADGELRLEALQAQGTNPPPPAVSSLVSELQHKIDILVKGARCSQTLVQTKLEFTRIQSSGWGKVLLLWRTFLQCPQPTFRIWRGGSATGIAISAMPWSSEIPQV